MFVCSLCVGAFIDKGVVIPSVKGLSPVKRRLFALFCVRAFIDEGVFLKPMKEFSPAKRRLFAHFVLELLLIMV